MMSATASLGLILLWDVDGGLTMIDKYLYSSEDYIKVSFLFTPLQLIAFHSVIAYLKLQPILLCMQYSKYIY